MNLRYSVFIPDLDRKYRRNPEQLNQETCIPDLGFRVSSVGRQTPWMCFVQLSAAILSPLVGPIPQK